MNSQLVLPLPDTGNEPLLNGGNRSRGTTLLTTKVIQPSGTVLVKESVHRFARETEHVVCDIPPQSDLESLGLEPTLQDEPAAAIK